VYTSQRSDTESANIGKFLWCWVQNPTVVGSLVPSGRELSRLMVKELGPGARVLELGSGTGTVTRAILEAGVDAEDLEIVEKDPAFIAMMRVKYPHVAAHQIDATTIARQLGHLSGKLDCVVSGLPLLLFSRAQRMRIVASAFSLRRDGGVLHQFTYGARCPIDRRLLKRLKLKATRVGIAAKNFPPAFVYRISRSAEQDGA